MKNTRIIATLAAVAGLAAASSANAAFVFIDTQTPIGSSATGISSLNNFRSQLAGQGVTSMYLGRRLGVTSPFDGSYEIDVDFFAAESSYRNQFILDGDVVIDNQGNRSWSNRDRGAYRIDSGMVTGSGSQRALDLSFCAVTINDCHTNAQNDTTRSTSLQSIGMWLSSDRNTAWLLWDDSGNRADDNHDDLIIRLTYRSVPEPGTLALLGLGLVGVAMFRRRKIAGQN